MVWVFAFSSKAPHRPFQEKLKESNNMEQRQQRDDPHKGDDDAQLVALDDLIHLQYP